MIFYKNYVIQPSTGGILVPQLSIVATHKDYDGSLEGDGTQYFYAGSVAEARDIIDLLEMEAEDGA